MQAVFMKHAYALVSPRSLSATEYHLLMKIKSIERYWICLSGLNRSIFQERVASNKYIQKPHKFI